ncbi:MAG TPA: 2-oxo-4-hydroxy-4-carboxy-5-ureidoimidazoline decarboxylase [Longimicrobiales bacterium]
MKRPLSAASERTLRSALRQCGLTSAAVKAVVEQRPFADDSGLCDVVSDVVLRLDDRELGRALAAAPEPVIEQGAEEVRQAARLALRLYRDRFGYPYVSSIGAPAADELLMRVRIRLGNDPVPEGRAARDHLRRLVLARLQTLMHAE